MKFYKIRHKKSGLFYTPSKHRYGTFSLTGKTYQRKPKVEQMCTMRFPMFFVFGWKNPRGKIYDILHKHFIQYESCQQECWKPNYDDWEVVEYEVKE